MISVTIPRRRRILMLPGFAQNAEVMRTKLHRVELDLLNQYELVFLDPPLSVQIPTRAGETGSASSSIEGPEGNPSQRAWWIWSGLGFSPEYLGIEQSLLYLRDFLEREDEFDGIWGFSQGSVVASLLCAILQNKSLHPEFRTCNASPFKFAILCGGFYAQDLALKKYFKNSIMTPSLHIVGRGDTVAPSDAAMILAKYYSNREILYHDGAHHVPVKPVWRAFYLEFINSFFSEVAVVVEKPFGSSTLLGDVGEAVLTLRGREMVAKL